MKQQNTQARSMLAVILIVLAMGASGLPAVWIYGLYHPDKPTDYAYSIPIGGAILVAGIILYGVWRAGLFIWRGPTHGKTSEEMAPMRLDAVTRFAGCIQYVRSTCHAAIVGLALWEIRDFVTYDPKPLGWNGLWFAIALWLVSYFLFLGLLVFEEICLRLDLPVEWAKRPAKVAFQRTEDWLYEKQKALDAKRGIVTEKPAPYRSASILPGQRKKPIEPPAPENTSMWGEDSN